MTKVSSTKATNSTHSHTFSECLRRNSSSRHKSLFASSDSVVKGYSCTLANELNRHTNTILQRTAKNPVLNVCRSCGKSHRAFRHTKHTASKCESLAKRYKHSRVSNQCRRLNKVVIQVLLVKKYCFFPVCVGLRLSVELSSLKKNTVSRIAVFCSVIKNIKKLSLRTRRIYGLCDNAIKSS